MSNQMKKILLLSVVLSGIVFVLSGVIILVTGQFLSYLSFVILGVSGVLNLLLMCLYIAIKKEEKEFKKNIAYYKILNVQRDKAILDFYNKFGIKPQYNKEGRLLLPDEVLGILTKLDESGKLDPSIYERLGILPKFDENGKEIPQIMVLKHLIRSIKKEGLKDLPKLKGLYMKGTKKEKDKADEKNASKDNSKKSEDGKKSKSAKKDKFNRYGSKDADLRKKDSKKDDKKGDKKEDKKDSPAKPQIKKVEVEKKQEPKVEKVEIPESIKKSGSDYLNKMYNKKPEPKTENQTVKQSAEEEFGEGTLE